MVTLLKLIDQFWGATLAMLGRRVAIVAACFGVSVAAAQSPRFETLNAESGLPGFSVWDVTQDQRGFLWFATVAGLVRYDNFTLESVGNEAPWADEHIRVLHVDATNTLWIGTGRKGVFALDSDSETTTFQHSEDNVATLGSNRIFALTDDDHGSIWVGTDAGLDRIRVDSNEVRRFTKLPDDMAGAPVRSLITGHSEQLWVGTYRGLAVIDPATNHVRRIPLPADQQKIVSLFEDDHGLLWIGTNAGLLRYNPRTRVLDSPIPLLRESPVVAIENSELGLWFGTIGQGLFLRRPTGEVNVFEYHPGQDSLPDNVVMSLFAEPGALWAGTFNNGVARLDTGTLAFGRHDNLAGVTACMESAVVYSVYTLDDHSLWIGSDAGAAHVNRSTGECHWLPAVPNDVNSLGRNVISFERTRAGELYATSDSGLTLIDETDRQIETIATDKISALINFALEWQTGELLIGSADGLHRLALDSGEQERVLPEAKALESVGFWAGELDNEGRVWLATGAGVALLDDDGKLDQFRHQGRAVTAGAVNDVHVDAENRVWAGLESQGLSVFHMDGRLLKHYSKQDGIPAEVMAIESDLQGSIWVSTLAGLVRIAASGEIDRIYEADDGLQGNAFSRGASHLAGNGELFFGGRLGFNAFYPTDIEPNTTAPVVALSRLRVQNVVIQPGGDTSVFELAEPIDRVSRLEFEHHHRMFSIELVALKTAQPHRVRFAYQLEGFDDGWNELEPPERVATYTNLSPGRYTFRTRAANADGVWSESGTPIDVVIRPPPWNTWWARTLILAVLAGVVGIVSWRRAARQRRQREQLEQQVAERTREVRQQKDAIEDILKRKNALFENLSHEFRTPLTLLLGPLEQLKKQTMQPRSLDQLELATSNAKRLLTMVEQLLSLAETSRDEPLVTAARQVAPVVHTLLASFASAARDKSIELTTGTMPDVSTKTSKDALEIIVGNLMSNAIKYTPEHGAVRVEVNVGTEAVAIHVIDDGPGIPAEQIGTIFDRFERLPAHAELPGSGLGLAVARELADANGGSLECLPADGGGAHFVATFPLSQEVGIVATQLSESVARLADTESSVQAEATDTLGDAPPQDNDERPTVLVIDDHPQMRRYVADVLTGKYTVLSAASGKEGINLALEDVPDLVICDVMMPEMDGYDVSRQLRDSDTTSHIPIVLLTARGDRESRLRGWSESVDAYVKKPFDAEELVSRIAGLLRVRKLLSSKRGDSISAGETTAVTEGLTLRDQRFLTNLQSVVEKNFGTADFGRTQMADLLAVSERQLQRKMKALIDQNPSVYLRECRLRYAHDRLVQGYAISEVAFDCGFSSASYFTKCFREKFGMPPKRFQTEAQKQQS